MPLGPARAARLVGGLLIGFSVISLAHFLSVEPALQTSADAVAFVRTHELRMRLGIVHDLAIFVMVGALAVAAYLGLRRFGPGLALFGLVAMTIEASVSVAIELSSIAAIHLGLASEPPPGVLDLVLVLRASGYQIVIVLFAASTWAFASLLRRAGYVPRPLASFGMLASALLLAATVLAICTPSTSSLVTAAQIGVGTASGLAMLFQVALGGRLLARGVSSP